MKSGKKNDHYQKYLASIHNNWITPDEIIQNLAKEATGQNVKYKFRIIAGEANEVYDLTLSDGKHVILRISTSGHPNFLQEKWALEKVKKLGVSVPEILLIKFLTIKGKEKSLCLMEKVEGEPLERGNINFDNLDLSLRRNLINQAGEILTKIHSIQTEGLGWIIGEGKAEFKTSDQLIDNLVSKQDEVEKMAKEENINQAHIENAYRIIKSFRTLYSKVVPHLNHGDYSHKHFMVKDDKIICILDWGGVRSDTPIYDFANWDYWFGEYIPTEWLKEGYTDKSLFDDNFEDFLHMWRLFKGLEILNWYHQSNYKPAVKEAKVKLIKDLDYFN
ncbi:MAG: aminoglycoside phosphotransferase family protein [Candidatus Daviesbacteria bacterium]|nr:aminoglycoside phosphotransferase family protein [Candidatus Daviesbacteria bacterium]